MTPTARVAASAEAARALVATFVSPSRVVVVGASRDPDAVARRPLGYLRDAGFPGEVVVVHPRATDTLDGYPVAPSIAEAAPADLALVLVPAPAVEEALAGCVAAGIDRAIVIASGFEGDAGGDARRRIEALLAEYPRLRIVGPNSVGVLGLATHAPLCFSSVLQREQLVAGRVGLVTQSGALGNALLLALHRRGVSVAHWFSTGDELSVGAIEVATGLVSDDACDVVGVFLEGMGDAHLLPALAEAIATTGKRVVALRAASSEAGRAAAFGHTGRLLGDGALSRAALRQSGVHVVHRFDDLCDALTVTGALPPRPDVADPARLAVVTVSGGAGVLAADAAARSPGLELVGLAPDVRSRVARVAPPRTAPSNPLDVAALDDTASFVRCIEALAQPDTCDAAVVVASSLAHDYDLLAASGPFAVPVVVAHLSPEERFSTAQARSLAGRGVATVPTAEGAVRALRVWAGAPAWSPTGRQTGVAPAAPGAGQLGLIGSVTRLGPAFERYVARMTVAPSLGEARTAALGLDGGGGVVVKADGATTTHRTEAGAVRIVPDVERDLAQAYAHVAAARAGEDRIVVQELIRGHIELFVSAVHDPEAGVVVLVGLGGILVELGLPPVVLAGDRGLWSRLLEPSPAGALLAGYRGGPPGDLAALLDLLCVLSDALASDPAIASVECNPVLVRGPGEGVTAVDVVVGLAAGHAGREVTA